MSVCTFPNDTKITTMTPLRSENILITCKHNIYKMNRQSLFHKKFCLFSKFLQKFPRFLWGNVNIMMLATGHCQSFSEMKYRLNSFCTIKSL